MANLTRWDPFQDMVSLREAMDSLFESAFIGPGSVRGGREMGQMTLPVDVEETEDAFIVKASIPGINPEDLSVTVQDNVLTIKGEMKGEEEQQNQRYHMRERRYGTFSRSIALPVSVDANKVEAEYSNGVLTLGLPKAEETKPKRISIKGGGSQKMIEGQATGKK